MSAPSTNLSELRGRTNQPDATGALSFPKLLQSSIGQIAAALPRHITPERMLRVALTAFRQQPLLSKCEPKSVLASVFIAAQLGLEIGVLGHAYLLPFWNNKNRRYECQLIVGYQGYIELARRTGQLLSVETHVIYEKDDYTLSYGLAPVFEHKPFLDGEPGKPRLVYCLARFKDGGQHLELMTWSEVMKIKARSPARNKDGQIVGPWISDEIEMARKTVVRRARKYWPQSVELATASFHDGHATVLRTDEITKELLAAPDDHALIDGDTGEILDGGDGGDQQQTEGANGAGGAQSDAGTDTAPAKDGPDGGPQPPAKSDAPAGTGNPKAAPKKSNRTIE